jgi:hypothetical protein
MRKEMESLYKRIADLEHVSTEHSHDGMGQPMIKIGTKNVPNLVYRFVGWSSMTGICRPDGTVRVEDVYGPIQFPLKASKG